MSTITLANNQQLHIRPAVITMVLDAGALSQVSGFGPGSLSVQEAAQVLLNRLNLTADFDRFTTQHGTDIWICRSAVSMVRDPMAGEHGHAVLLVAGEQQSVNQTVAAVRAATGL